MQGLTEQQARTIAERAHAGHTDRLGHPEIDHVARVAANVPEAARPIAWLHDATEDGYVTYDELAEYGASDTQLAALALLDRSLHNGTYMDYIRVIADGEGDAGVFARDVKEADLDDNMTRECPPEMNDMRRPGGRYDRARRIIAAAKSAPGAA